MAQHYCPTFGWEKLKMMAFTQHLAPSRDLASICWSHWQRCDKIWAKAALTRWRFLYLVGFILLCWPWAAFKNWLIILSIVLNWRLPSYFTILWPHGSALSENMLFSAIIEHAGGIVLLWSCGACVSSESIGGPRKAVLGTSVSGSGVLFALRIYSEVIRL